MACLWTASVPAGGGSLSASASARAIFAAAEPSGTEPCSAVGVEEVSVKKEQDEPRWRR
jgi:hypothetical protein